VRRIARATYHAGVIFLFVLVAIAGFTQTRAFKSYLRDQILEQASKALLADLSIGSVDGNLITGFVLHDIQLSISGEPVVSSEQCGPGSPADIHLAGTERRLECRSHCETDPNGFHRKFLDRRSP
jgi:hypothetical protein